MWFATSVFQVVAASSQCGRGDVPLAPLAWETWFVVARLR